MIDLVKMYSKLLTPSAKRKFVLLTILCVIGAFFDTLGVSVIFPYISALTDPGSIFDSELLKPFIVPLSLTEDNIIIVLSVVLLVVYLVKNIFLFSFNLAKRKYILDECFETTKRAYQIYLEKPYVFFLNQNSDELTNVINVYITKAFVLLQTFMSLLGEVVVVMLLVAFMLLVDPLVTVLVAVVYGATLFVLKKCVSEKVAKIGEISLINYGHLTKTVAQSFRGIQDVKILRSNKRLLEDFDKYSYGNVKAEIEKTALYTLPNHLVEFISISVMIACILAALQADSSGDIFAKVSSFAMVLLRIRPGVMRIYQYTNDLKFYKAFADQMDGELLESKPESLRTDEDAQISFNSNISVQDICFSYEGREAVFDHINFDVAKGTTVGIKGPSGGGKTTLANIILGLLEPEAGNLCVDGVEINHQNMAGWHKLISYIPQSIFLLDGTILENIVFFRDFDEEKIWQSLEKANLKEFVEELPDGLNTLVGERGVKLSGGQRQRLGIARAVYGEAQVFIFDEPTAALDYDLEKEVMSAIYALEDRTVILIAHRLNTLKLCDKVYDLTDGKLVEVSIDDLD